MCCVLTSGIKATSNFFLREFYCWCYYFVVSASAVANQQKEKEKNGQDNKKNPLITQKAREWTGEEEETVWYSEFVGLVCVCVCVCMGNVMDGKSLISAACKTLMNNTGIYQLIVCFSALLSTLCSCSHSLSASDICFFSFNEKHLWELLIRPPLFCSHSTSSPSFPYSVVSLVSFKTAFFRMAFWDHRTQRVRFWFVPDVQWRGNYVFTVPKEHECTALSLILQCIKFSIYLNKHLNWCLFTLKESQLDHTQWVIFQPRPGKNYSCYLFFSTLANPPVISVCSRMTSFSFKMEKSGFLSTRNSFYLLLYLFIYYLLRSVKFDSCVKNGVNQKSLYRSFWEQI